MSDDPQQLKVEIEHTRARLGETVAVGALAATLVVFSRRRRR